MSVVDADRDRRVIPRWRDFSRAAALGELRSVGRPTAATPTSAAGFTKRLQEWQHSRTFSFAADLVSCAVALRRGSEVGDAAEFVLEARVKGFDSAKGLARTILGVAHEDESDGDHVQRGMDTEAWRSRIHRLRLRLHETPRNALMCADLSLAYETLGFPVQARRSMEMALGLAPANRHILRCASRLFVHQDDFGRAHDLLRSSDSVRSDPWLLAAEIAVSAAGRRTSRFVKHARALLQSGRFRQFDLSELASAIGTLELEAGNRKRARRLLRDSLADPSENAIAQAAWTGRRSPVIEIEQRLLADGPSAEARAWASYHDGRWQDVVVEADKWLWDQPFSIRPAMLGSYVAAICLGAYERCAEIAEQGLVANPGDFILLNNRAFGLAQLGRIDEANKVFSRMKRDTLSHEDRVAWSATTGLLRYRSGDIVEGKACYQEALELASKRPDSRRRALASFFFTMEELRAGTAEAEGYRRQVTEEFKNTGFSDVDALLQRVREFPSHHESGARGS